MKTSRKTKKKTAPIPIRVTLEKVRTVNPAKAMSTKTSRMRTRKERTRKERTRAATVGLVKKKMIPKMILMTKRNLNLEMTLVLLRTRTKMVRVIFPKVLERVETMMISIPVLKQTKQLGLTPKTL